MQCDPRELLRFSREVLESIGVPVALAADMAGQIVASEVSGHESHGLRRLAEYVDRAREGFADPRAVPVVDDDQGSLVRLDGGFGFGHVVMREATKIAVERAKEHGIAAVAVHRAEPAGRFVDFCEWAAEWGVATLVFVNSGGGGQVVAPPGGTEARLSTNPIAAGIPRLAAPHLVLDMATSTVAMGRVSEWRDRGASLPADWTDGSGVLQFVGGGKGFGLAVIAEALAGVLSSAGAVSAHPEGDRQGVFMIAIDVERLRPLTDFAEHVDAFIDHVKDVPLSCAGEQVRVPGERSAQTAEARRAVTPVQAFTWKSLRMLAGSLQIAPPRSKEEHS